MTPSPTCRFGNRCALTTYEDAVECLGSHSDQTRTEIARRAATFAPGRSEAYLRSCLSPNDGTHNIQLAIAPALFRASGNPALLVWHALACGYGVYRQPTSGSRDEPLIAMNDVVVAVGDVAREVKVALGDRRVTAEEREAVRALVRRAQAELAEVAAAVDLDAEAREIA